MLIKITQVTGYIYKLYNLPLENVDKRFEEKLQFFALLQKRPE